MNDMVYKPDQSEFVDAIVTLLMFVLPARSWVIWICLKLLVLTRLVTRWRNSCVPTPLGWNLWQDELPGPLLLLGQFLLRFAWCWRTRELQWRLVEFAWKCVQFFWIGCEGQQSPKLGVRMLVGCGWLLRRLLIWCFRCKRRGFWHARVRFEDATLALCRILGPSIWPSCSIRLVSIDGFPDAFLK